MPRPFKTRRIYGEFASDYFKPRGRRLSELEEIHLEADEIEALRLADLKDEYQNDAADKMGISRQTFGNILKRAHKKVADGLINGKAILLTPAVSGKIWCRNCGGTWAETDLFAEREQCPICFSNEVELEARHHSGHGRRKGHKR
ncbi:MAG: DUF134 domain-containing protein [Candidatus Marinimicrobia bacterium]|nr:DUF134 domain-containing protein [Candidatus Neomarinimicrobiota bacterium]